MPHLVLEYSANVVEQGEHRALFAQLHAALLELQTFALQDLKSRAIRLEDYHLADGDPQRAMVHLTLSIMAGRDISVRQRVMHAAQRVLAQYYARSLAERDCQISVEIREMDRSTYAKQRGPAPAG